MTQRENKKIVAFDTSFVSRVSEEKIDIDEQFPDKKYQRFIQDTVMEEWMFNPDGSWYDEGRPLLAKIYREKGLSIMDPFESLILREYLQGSRHVKLERHEEAEKEIQSFLEGTNPNQESMETHFKIYYEKRKEAKKNIYLAVFSNDKISKVSLSIFKSQLAETIEKRVPLPIPLISKEDICDFSNDKPTTIEMKGNSFFLSVEVEEKRNRIGNFREFRNLENDFPTIYGLLMYDFFINFLKQKEEITPLADQFYIQIENVKQDIKVTRNLLPDFRISLQSLPYIDEFATCDKGQAQLIKGLFPQYGSRVRYFCKKRGERGETYEDCTKEL